MPTKKQKKPKPKAAKPKEKELLREIRAQDHIYVPKHEVLPPEEAAKILQRHNAQADQFPYILESDPVAQEIGAKPGDLVRVTRRSETAGVTMFYRLVVS